MADNDNEIVPSLTRGSRTPTFSGEEDVEGHARGDESEAGPDSLTRGSRTPTVIGDDEAPGPDGLK